MVRAPGPTARRVGIYSVFVLLVCPALLWWGAVDLPDEYLEFNCAGLAFHARELAAGRLPQWNPYVLGGMPVAADPTSVGPWYPLGWLLPLIPLNGFVFAAWVLHLGVGGAGVHRLTERAGAGTTGARAAAATWLTGTTCVSALVDGQLDMVALLAWLPWALVALQGAFEAADDRRRLRSAALAGAALGLVGLGTHARFAAIGFAAVGTWAAILWLVARPGGRPTLGRWAAVCGGALALGTLLAAPELVPALAEVRATRSGAPPDGPLLGQALSWAGLTGLVYPRALVIDQRWYHLGPALLLLPWGLRAGRRAAAFTIAGVAGVLVGMGSAGPLGPLLKPVLWALYPVETGAAAVAALFLAVGVGVAVDRVLTGDAPSPVAIGAVAGVGVLVVALGGRADLGLYFADVAGPAHLARISVVHGAVAVALLAAALVARRRAGPTIAGAVLLALVVGDGLLYAWRVEAAIPSPRVAPSQFVERPDALAGLDDATTGRVVQLPLRPVRELQGRTVDDLFSHPGHGWGHDPSFDPTHGIAHEARATLAGPLRRNAGGAFGVAMAGGRAKVPPMPWSVLTQGLAPPRRGPPGAGGRPELARSPAVLGRTLELLGVRWVVSTTEDWPLPPVRRLEASASASLRAELLDPRPPALLSPRTAVIPDAREALRELLHGTTDLRARAVVGETAPGLAVGGGGSEPVEGEVVNRRPGTWEIRLPEHAGGVLTIEERFHPGWTATDGSGHPLPALRANLVQQGVAVPAGVRSVVVRFRAPGAALGMWLGLFGLAALGAGLRGRG